MGIPVIAIHGGAGALSGLDEHQAKPYHDGLRYILQQAQQALQEGQSAMDAVCLAVSLLEDNPLFNAGHGAVFTHDGTHELDAAVMNGADLRAGAVAGICHIQHPVLAARAVMEDGRHVLLAGAGAEKFLREYGGLAWVEPDFFSTPMRREQLEKALQQERVALDHDVAVSQKGPQPPIDESRKMGTVGAVALDQYGHLAAATSTGGMTNKHAGRIGDSPLIGAGTYAEDRAAAVSCTGHGEMFIRVAAAYDVCARMLYAKQTLEQATQQVIMKTLPPMNGRGGLIAVDAAGNVCMPMNSEGMYRGYARGATEPVTAIYAE